MGLGTPVFAALRPERLDEAVEVLARATREGQVAAAVLHVVQREASFSRSFGKAQTEHAMFLLGSISKPINAPQCHSQRPTVAPVSRGWLRRYEHPRCRTGVASTTAVSLLQPLIDPAGGG